MSLDISSFLKNEIAKKRKELESSSKKAVKDPSPVEETLSEENEHNEYDDNDTSKKDQDIIEEPSLLTQLDRLKSRPKRVDDIIAADSNISSKIDPTTIGDTSKLKYLSLQCNLYIHEILNNWDEESNDYHGELLIDTKKSLFPLLIQLRRGTLAEDLVISLASVLYHLQQPKENNLAIESYMKLSIGNVAWPIGVTSVGIHARSAHSKIQGENGQIANIMVDDRTRLWITSIKRLITFKDWLDRREK